MSRAAGLSSVNCTNCGAGLSVLGGGRVLSHVCGYCGSVLDTQDNYKVVASIGARNHPESPIQIGMELNYDDVLFTVIGTLGKVETWRGRTSRWVEHQLFSPTHGYAWLSYEGGNFTFTRKVRDFNMAHWLSSDMVERAESPPRRAYRGQAYKYYETSTSRINFMEGEFNWIPQIDETTTTVVLLGPDAKLGLRDGALEREVELTRLLPRDGVVAAMDLPLSTTRPAPRHPLTPYVAGPNEPFLRRVLGAFALLALILWAGLGVMTGPRVLHVPTLPITAEVEQSYPFEVRNHAQLLLLEIATDVDNDWVTLALRVTGPDGNLVLEGPQTIQFYSGRSSDGSWTEGSRNADIRFRADMPGLHELSLMRLEGTGGNTANITITSGAPTPIWIFVVMIAFALGYIYLRAKRAMFMKNRLAGSDWHED